LSNVVMVSAAADHSLALKVDGSIVVWGSSSYGQTKVPSPLGPAVAAACGGSHVLAVMGSEAGNRLPILIGNAFPIAMLNTPYYSWFASKNGPVSYGATGLPLAMGINRTTGVIFGAPWVGGTFAVTIWATNAYGVARKDISLTIASPTPGIYSAPSALGYIGTPFTFAVQANNGPTSYGAAGLPVGFSIDPETGLITGIPSMVGEDTFTVFATNSYGFGKAGLRLNVREVATWGNSADGELDVPVGLSNVVAVAGGYQHSLALRNDGTLAAWGYNYYGQATVPAGLSNVVTISAGGAHNLALKADGGIVAWGLSSSGQTNLPVGLAGVVSIAAGDDHNLALKSDGTVVAWGYNNHGQTNVPLGLNNVMGVAAGLDHSVALKSDGTVVAWGDNAHGETNVPVGLSNVVSVVAGGEHNLALKADGTVVGWGDNTYGQGVAPVGLSNVVAVSAGSDHSMALKADGSTVVWGRNNSGQGNVPAALGPAIALAGGGSHSLAVMASESGSSLPLIICAKMAVGVVTNPFYLQPLVKNGPVVYGATGLPSGLAINATNGVIQGLPATAGTYAATVWATNQNGVGQQGIKISIIGRTTGTPPQITSQPKGGTFTSGTNITLSVTATSTTPLLYQWYKDGMALPGESNASMVMTDVRRTRAGAYSVWLTNAVGAVLSDPALVTILVPQKMSLLRVSQGLTVRFGDYDGGALGPSDLTRFRIWYSTNLVNWRLLSGVTFILTNTSGIAALPSIPNSTQCFFRIAETTDSNNQAPLFSPNPTGGVLVGGANYILQAGAIGAHPLSYQWFKDGLSLVGATNATLGLTNVHRAQGGSYSLWVSNPYGDAVSSNAVVRVKVPQRLSIQRDALGADTISFQDQDGGQLNTGDLSFFQVESSTNLNTWQYQPSLVLIVTNGTGRFVPPPLTNCSRSFFRMVEN